MLISRRVIVEYLVAVVARPKFLRFYSSEMRIEYSSNYVIVKNFRVATCYQQQLQLQYNVVMRSDLIIPNPCPRTRLKIDKTE